MKSKRKLLAAVTASGAVLYLSVSADSSIYPVGTEPANPFPELLSLRVEQLKEKHEVHVSCKSSHGCCGAGGLRRGFLFADADHADAHTHTNRHISHACVDSDGRVGGRYDRGWRC